MKRYEIKTKEPIKIYIELSDYGNDHTIIVKYKKTEYLYAFIKYGDKPTAEKIRQWVEETYYSLDFTCPQYTPAEINL